MKKRLPLILLGVILLWTLSALRPARDKADALKVHAFGRLPVVLNGRVQPIDSVARNALIIISGKQSLTLEGNGGNKKYWGDLLEISQHADAAPLKLRDWWQFGKHPQKMTAVEWLMEAAMTPDVADRRYIFRIHHPEVIRDMELETGGVEKSGMHWYSYNELKPKFSLISEQVERIRGIDAKLRSPYERQMTQVFSSLGLYRRIKNSFRPEESHNFPAEIQAYEQNLRPGIAAIRNQMAGHPFDEKAVEAIRGSLQQYEQLQQLAYPLIIPPSPNSADREAWSNIGTSLVNAAFSNGVPPEVTAYANLVSAYRRSDSGTFNHIVEGFRVHLEHSIPAEVKKGSREHFFNSYAPFRKSIVLYLFAFVLACCSWLNMSDNLRKSAFYLIILSFVIHTSGLIFRMVLEGRPPVTNLYSSAVFIGWGAVLLGLILERFHRNGIGIVTAASVGFVTLLIAHFLSLKGDTMEMMQAVLDTNAWLATHVVVINLGYSSTYIAGFLAIIYVLRGVFTTSLTKDTAKSLGRMVYGIVCFATLFSFVGTVLGGIWADQSWGRFWGWDPKENGALMIVIWNATILHARWGGMIRERGIMVMAIFGNVITSWSYFGVNTLAIGLHSYGHMDGSYKWLMIFNAVQVVFMVCGGIPQRFWLSFAPRFQGAKA